MLVIRAGIHKLLVRIANREDASSLIWVYAVCPFCQATSVVNFRTFTVYVKCQTVQIQMKCGSTGSALFADMGNLQGPKYFFIWNSNPLIYTMNHAQLIMIYIP